MDILFENKNSISPKVSIILLDWSCRESFKIFRYLNDQTVPREKYEIIWTEFYSRRATEIRVSLKESERLGNPPIVDKWIVLDMPGTVYYHKHLMYNIGLVASKGEIVVFCDSDVIVRPTFVQSIIKKFVEDSNIVLHMDEVRNNDRRFYPFNYPSIEKIIGEGCANWEDDKTTGLLDKEDPLHTRNYGACMCARRSDLINIGGADEHMAYLGYICGPYEMTFRLVNIGKKEIWHQEEFIYHTWHPSTNGKGNHSGPHDGLSMSTIALDVCRTGRVMPLVENSAIRTLRLKQDDIIYEPLLLQAIPEEDIKAWTIEKLRQYKRPIYFWEWRDFIKHPIVNLLLTITFLKMITKQFHMKATKFSRQSKSIKDVLRKVFTAYNFLKNLIQYNIYIRDRCENCLKECASRNIQKFALFGTGDVAKVLYKLTLSGPVKIDAVYEKLENRSFFNFDVMPVEEIKEYKGKVVVATLAGLEDSVELLKRMGVKNDRIVIL